MIGERSRAWSEAVRTGRWERKARRVGSGSGQDVESRKEHGRSLWPTAKRFSSPGQIAPLPRDAEGRRGLTRLSVPMIVGPHTLIAVRRRSVPNAPVVACRAILRTTYSGLEVNKVGNSPDLLCSETQSFQHQRPSHAWSKTVSLGDPLP